MLAVWIALWPAVGSASSSLCPDGNDVPFKQRMATKTAYYVSAGVLSVVPPACSGEASMLNVVARHGTRHSSHIVELEALATKLNQFANAPAWVSQWHYPVSPSQKSVLIGRGLSEHFELAGRLLRAHPSAFPREGEHYSPTQYPIQATYKSRSAQSAEAFALGALAKAEAPADFLSGLAGATAFVDVKSGDEDRQLRFHDNCAAFETTLDPESMKYRASAEIGEALTTFACAATGGLSPNEAGLTVEDLLLAYEGCAYELILRDEANTFCALGIAEHVDVLEYAKDIEEWYENAGGNPLAAQAPLLLLRDIVSAFDAFIDGTLRGSWRFAHAETVMPLATMLGIFDGQQDLTADYRDEARLFKTSCVSPMAANLVASLHNCTDGWRVKFALNERDVRLPVCDTYCPLDTFKSAFSAALYEWDFDTVCRNKGPVAGCGS